jgi:hypothetical protein
MDDEAARRNAAEIDGMVAAILEVLASKLERTAAIALAGVVSSWLATMPTQEEREAELKRWLELVRDLTTDKLTPPRTLQS